MRGFRTGRDAHPTESVVRDGTDASGCVDLGRAGMPILRCSASWEWGGAPVGRAGMPILRCSASLEWGGAPVGRAGMPILR